MQVIKVLIVLLALSVSPARAEIPSTSSDNQSVVRDADLEAAGVYRYWVANLPLGPGDRLKEAHRVDDALYVATHRGSLFALTAGEGLIRWADKLTQPQYRIYRPAHLIGTDGSSQVAVPTTTEIFIFNRYSGDRVRRFTPPFPIGGTAVGYEGALLMGGADARFYSLELSDPRSPDPFIRWVVSARGPVTAAPVLYDNEKIVFASHDGTVFSCRAHDKVLYWSFRTGGPILGDPAVADDGVYVASMDRSLYKIDSATGRQLWRLRMPRPLTGGPVVVGETVYQYCLSQGLSAVDAATGRQRWNMERAESFAARTPQGDFVVLAGGEIVLLDPVRGNVLHRINAPGAAAVVTNTADDAMYVLGRTGRVVCLRLDSVPYLRRQQILAARARLRLGPAPATPGRQDDTAPSRFTRRGDDPLRSRHDIKP